ncbi:MAG: tetratricopeptide repeat protein [Deltaproteobacteria bacterium]|nr:tetratricopeptide repeat protein [Deltaproteobacteria bacterium]
MKGFKAGALWARVQGVKGKSVTHHSSFITFLLLFTVHCSLFTAFYGCASAKIDKISPEKKTAIDLNYAGVEESNNYEKALKKFEQALVLNKKTDNRKGIILNKINIARTCLKISRYDEALSSIQDAVQMAESEKDNLLLSEAYATLSKYHYLKGKTDESIKYLEMAIDIDRRNGFPSIGDKLNLKALAYKEKGELDKSLDILNEAMKKNQGAERKAGISDSYRITAGILLLKKQFEYAKQNFENALAIDKELGRPNAIALDLSGLASIHIEKGDYRGALDYLKRAYDVNTANNDRKNALADLDRIIETAAMLKDEDAVTFFLDKRKKLISQDNQLNK